jgi:hypothetical protein
MSIHATLHTAPTSRPVHEMIYITRGASAELLYPLHDKVFRAQDIDQITFTFKQGKTLYWYSMFTYIIPSEDTAVQQDKKYYTVTLDTAEASIPCSIEEVKNPTGNPKELNYYEISDAANLNWKTSKYALDPHFYLFENDEYGAVIFNLDCEETKQFKPGITVEYEIAVKLNTDSFASMSHKDSIIIEPQHPIAVIDSLYSKV